MPAKIYNAAPLPFMGQKRRFVSQFREALRDFPTTTVFVDLFGGSGLLSHIAKRVRPDARVVYNDFDDFHLRVENVARTNAILDRIRAILADAPSMKKVDTAKRRAILDLLECHLRYVRLLRLPVEQGRRRFQDFGPLRRFRCRPRTGQRSAGRVQAVLPRLNRHKNYRSAPSADMVATNPNTRMLDAPRITDYRLPQADYRRRKMAYSKNRIGI